MIPGGGGRGATRNGLPWPEGDPGALADAASAASGAAHAVRGGVTRVEAAAGAASGWHGQAAAAFQGAVAAERASMLRGATALDGAAGALRRLSTTLDEAQELVRELANEVEEAEEAARIASARAVFEQASAAWAQTQLMLAGPDPSPSLQQGASAAADDAAVAANAAAGAQAHADAVRTRNTERAQDACDEVRRQDTATAAAVDDAAGAAPLAGVRAGTPTPAQAFATVALSGLSERQWRDIAYWAAGIDGGAWDPRAGLLANDETVQRVYRLYGDLFLAHPELQWAGMANLVGPMFYAGWQDIYAIRHAVDPGERADLLAQWIGLGGLPGWVKTSADVAGHLPGGFLSPTDLAGHLGSDELEWFEGTFLEMQKAIFDDLAYKHVAYSLGGIGLLRGMADEGLVDARELRHWEDIASGSPERVAQGNEGLLFREQHDIIQGRYDEMRDHHGPVGDAFTYATTIVADNPIEGGRSYRDLYPIQVEIEAPTPQVPFTDWPERPNIATVDLPLPSGNISDFDDRWRWISEDMLPAYRDQLAQPGAVEAVVRQDVADRADDHRRLPDFVYPGG
jgi:hypothetical protein